MTRLFVAKANGDLVREVQLDGRRFLSIGRSPRCQIELDARSISRRHALLFFSGGVWHLIDTGSMSGIWSRDRRRQHLILNTDSWVRIGPAYFWITPSNDPPQAVGHSVFESQNHDFRIGQPDDPDNASRHDQAIGDLLVSVLEPHATRFRQVVITEEQGMITFGRGQNCDLSIDDPAVSTLHGVLYRESTRWCVADCGSRAGIVAGGHRYLRKRLETELVIRIGSSVLRVEKAINSCSVSVYENFSPEELLAA